jgi:hypothetical protein
METRVAKIISETTVVLAAGSNQGVQLGQKFVIFEPGEEIVDPETQTPLGKLEVVKGRVQVEHVMPNLCTASTDFRRETRMRSISPYAALNISRVIGSLQEPYQIEVGDKLKVREGDIDSRYVNPDRTVRVGDRVRQIEN